MEFESEIKSSLIKVLVNKADALEKQDKLLATPSDLSKGDISYHGMNSNEGLSDDEVSTKIQIGSKINFSNFGN